MKIMTLLFGLIFLINSSVSYSQKGDSRKPKAKTNENSKPNIPVDKANKYFASSVTENYLGSYALDYDAETYWSPRENGINEWLAVYIGSLKTIGRLSQCNIKILDGYFNYDEGSIEFSKPVKYEIEFYIDENLIFKQTISKMKHDSNNDFPGYIASDFDFGNLKYENGTLWLKVIILETEKTGSAAIRDIRLTFKNANPYDAYNEISVFCSAINQSEKNVISNFTEKSPIEVLAQFTSEYGPEDAAGCRMGDFEVHSDNIVSLHAVEGGDGESRAFFKYENGKWRLYKFSYFSYF